MLRIVTHSLKSFPEDFRSRLIHPDENTLIQPGMNQLIINISNYYFKHASITGLYLHTLMTNYEVSKPDKICFTVLVLYEVCFMSNIYTFCYHVSKEKK